MKDETLKSLKGIRSGDFWLSIAALGCYANEVFTSKYYINSGYFIGACILLLNYSSINRVIKFEIDEKSKTSLVESILYVVLFGLYIFDILKK